MQEQPVIAVRGEIVLVVEPEIARLELSTVARDAERARAMQLLEDRAAAVDKILASFPDAIERTGTSGLRVSPELTSSPSPSPSPVTGYLGVVRQTIAVTGFDRIGELMAQLAGEELTEVGGPWWELRPGSPVYRQARVAAATDAVRRARDYARALGSELAGLVELADARLLSEGTGQGEHAPRLTARLPQRTRVASPEEFTFDLAPAKQTVRATVEARFRISQPDLAAVAAEPEQEPG
jgi:uncharacterized protein YggE